MHVCVCMCVYVCGYVYFLRVCTVCVMCVSMMHIASTCILTSSAPQLFIHNFVHGDLHPGNILVQDEVGDKASPKLVLLDCGITNSLTKADLENFKKTFLYIVQNQVSRPF